jgi:hypothetical protein
MLDGPGIESPWGRGFAHPSRSALGPINYAVRWVQGLFARGKANGTWRGVDNSPPSSAEVKERVELYVFSIEVFWFVLGRSVGNVLHFMIQRSTPELDILRALKSLDSVLHLSVLQLRSHFFIRHHRRQLSSESPLCCGVTIAGKYNSLDIHRLLNDFVSAVKAV